MSEEKTTGSEKLSDFSPATEALSPPDQKSDTTDNTDRWIGTVIDKRFRVDSLIGTGGMSVVYQATDMVLDRTVALKVLAAKASTKASARRRFQQEGKALSKLDHANIIKVFHFGITDDDVPYLVMEYLKGKSLAQILESEPRMRVASAVELMIQLSNALACAHAHGVIHRDLKPGNIVISPEFGAPQIKVIDFGVAKLRSESDLQNLTSTGDIFGSPLYMSPEQCRGTQCDQRTDIYSLGCVMFECLTGKPPFMGESALATMMMHQQDPPPALRDATLGKSFHAALEAIVAHTLAKDPDDRYQTAEALSKDLEHYREAEFEEIRKQKSKAHHKSPIGTKSGYGRHLQSPHLLYGLTVLLFAIAMIIVSGLRLKKSHPQLPSTGSVIQQNGNIPSQEKPAPAKPHSNYTIQEAHERWLKSMERYKRRPGSVTDDDLEAISHSRMSVLNLADNKWITDQGLLSVASMPTLQQLSLAGTNITDRGLQNLSGAKQLTYLVIAESRITDEGLKYLDGMHILHLDLSKNSDISDQGLKHILALTRLEELLLTGTAVTDDGMAELAKFNQLRVLDLSGTNVGDSGLSHVAQLTHLTYLKLADTKVTDKGIAEIRHMHLKFLGLFQDIITDTALSDIGSMRTLNQLGLGGTQVTDAGLAKLKNLNQLSKLNLDDNSAVTNAGIAKLANLTSLEQLSLRNASIDDGCASDLIKLKGLRDLRVLNTRMTEAGISKVAKHLNLSRLRWGPQSSQDD